MERVAAELLGSEVGVLLPLGEVRGRDLRLTLSPAGRPHVSDVVRLEEEEGLEFLHVVHTVTDDPGEADGPDLLELGRSEGPGVTTVLVPEPVPLPQVEELLPDDAGECRPDYSPHHGLLGHPAREQVDVVHVLVDVLQPGDRPPVHDVLQLVPVREPPQSALFSPDVVRSEAVVPTSLDVEAGEVHSELRPRGLEQVVGQLVGDELVPPGQLLTGEAQQDPVDRPEVVEVAGVVHFFVELDVEGDLTKFLIASVNTPLDQRVTESKWRQLELSSQ